MMGRVGSRTPAVLRRDQHAVVLLGVDLTDAREELFVRMVCDGLALGIAFVKAGFSSNSDKGRHVAAHALFNLPRIQNRAAAILEARCTQGVVTLPEVTDMLNRVYAKALHDDQLNAAHNAAFSLARLYGHVTDRAIVETVRKPSRDPDAPAERSLSNWIDALPVRALEGPGPSEGLGESPVEAASPSPRETIEGSDREPSSGPNPLISQGSGLESSPRQSGNGAPTSGVTGTHPTRAGSAVLSPGASKKRASKRLKVPVPSGAMKRKKRRMKDLFG